MQTLHERFLAKVNKNGSIPSHVPELSHCWEWIGSINSWGYGRFLVNGKNAIASRISYQIYVGDIPNGMSVLHKCDNPKCVRPSHLFIGTHDDNMKDAVKKNRILAGIKRPNAKLSIENVLRIRRRGESPRLLSKLFGVHPSTIGSCRAFKSYKNLEAICG